VVSGGPLAVTEENKTALTNLLLIIVLLLIGCSQPKPLPHLKRIDFLRVTSIKHQNRADLLAGDYLTFHFTKSYYLSDTITDDYSQSLFILIPASDSAFRFQKDSTHSFSHVVKKCRGFCSDLVREEIDTARITGRLLATDKWLIEAKTKYFDFRSVITLSAGEMEKETIKL
jgi:hypothetical protein